MKTQILYKYASLIGVLAFAAGTPLSLNAAKHNAPPQPPHNTPASQKNAPHGPVIGAYIGIQPPSGSIAIQVGNFSFRYNNGVYYKHTKHGYVVTQAPRGAIVHSLPPGHSRIVNNGYVYYCYNDVYYRQASSGYIVVQAPVTVIQQSSPVVTVSTSTPVSAEVSVWQGAQELLLRNGQFFQNTPAGLVWVDTPVGAITQSLSNDASIIWHQDIEYFDVDGVLFRKTPEGYKVVTPPWE